MPTFTIEYNGKRYSVDANTEGDAFEAVTQIAGSKRSPQADAAYRTKIAEDASRIAMRDTNPLLRPFVNLGAGLMNFNHDIRNLFPGGETDAQIDERRLRNRVAAEETPLGGLYQALGEYGPTMAIPAGGFLNATKAGVQGIANLGRALMGNEMKALALSPARSAAAAAADSALAGAALGGAQTTKSDESSLLNVILGGLGGALVPAVIAGSGKIGSMFTAGGAQRRAAQRLTEMLGGESEAQVAVDAIRAYKPHPQVVDVPMTPAEITQNERLMAGQMADQAKNAADWLPFRTAQNQARADALQGATNSAERLEQEIARRDEVTAPLRERALVKAQRDPFFTQPTVQTIEDLTGGDLRSSPSVQRVVSYVKGELDKGVTPAQLYTVRKTLTDLLHGPTKMGDDLSNAVKNADVATMRLVNGIDQGLDDATGGQWSKYLKKYATKSGEVDDATASKMLREFIADGPRFGAVGSDTPAITADRVRRGMEKVGENKYGSKFSDSTLDNLSAIANNADMTSQLANTIKKVGTSGGGSQTTPLAELARRSMSSKSPIVVPMFGRMIEDRTQGALGEMLRNPEPFVEAITRKLREGRPLTWQEDVMRNAIRAITVATPNELLSQ